MDDDAINEAVIVAMRNMIIRQLTSKMLKVVDELAAVFLHGFDSKQRELDALKGSNSAFPERAGLYITMSIPV